MLHVNDSFLSSVFINHFFFLRLPDASILFCSAPTKPVTLTPPSSCCKPGYAFTFLYGLLRFLLTWVFELTPCTILSMLLSFPFAPGVVVFFFYITSFYSRDTPSVNTMIPPPAFTNIMIPLSPTRLYCRHDTTFPQNDKKKTTIHDTVL